MVHDQYVSKIIGMSDISEKIEAVTALVPIMDDSKVMDALCEAAVSTTSYRLRKILVKALESNPADACKRFIEYALFSSSPSCRKWALVNLSLIGCRDAKKAVINGLSDPDSSVRIAAALSAGLYDDHDVLNALERYFESHRFGLTISFIKREYRPIEYENRRF